MSDTGHVPTGGLPPVGEQSAHDPFGSEGSQPQGAVRPPYTFLDQPDGPDDEDDELLMPGPQGSWSEPVAQPAGWAAEPAQPVQSAEPLLTAAQPAPEPPAPSWPPLNPPSASPVAPAAAAAVEQSQQTVATPPRRPLHAGPPIPDPSMMTGQVPVRSLADRGPSSHGDSVLAGTAGAGSPSTTTQHQGPEYLDQPAAAEPGSLQTATQAVPPTAAQPAEAAEPLATVPVQLPSPASTLGGNPVSAPVSPVSAPVPAPAPSPEAEQQSVQEPLQQQAPAPVTTEPFAQPLPAAVPDSASPAPAETVPVVGTEPVTEPSVEAPVEAVAVAVVEPVAEVAEPQAPAEPVIPAQVASPGGSSRISAFMAAPVAHTPAPQFAEAAPEPQPVAEAVVEPEATSLGTGLLTDSVSMLVPEAVLQAQPLPEQTPEPEVEAGTTGPAVEQEPATPAPEPQPERVAVADTAAEPGTDSVAEPVAEPVVAEPDVAEPVVYDGPAAPAYEDEMREAVHRVMRERRDIRNGFRSDPVPHDVLLRVLEAAHTAPSVGYSQPWDFVVIRSAKTRARMHELAERQRDAYAESLPKGRAKQFKELKIEAILETPINIVVTADRTRGGRHTLGRHTQPQMAPYSAALAVENLWLAARAEGLGVGWVSFFDEQEMIRELGLPEHLDVVAYLCVGYVNEFPVEPELAQAGWAKKRPLSWVVHEETYGRRALPGEEPHSVLQETLRGIRPLDAKALGEAWDRQKRMTKPAGSLGMLEIISAQLCGLSRKCPPPIPEPACVAVFAGDHGVHAQGVTPWPQEVTAQMVGNFLAGGAVVNAFAAQLGAEVCVVDVGVASELPPAVESGRTTGLLPRKVRLGTADMTQGPAMTREEALQAVEVGIETARDLVAAGNKALITGDMGIANTTAAAALICVFTGEDPSVVTGRGTGIDDETHARKVAVIREALALHRPDPADPIGVLAAVGGLEHAAIAGFLLGAASLRTPVILDGVIAGAAALAAKAIAPEVLAACIAGHRSAEPGHKAALAKLGLRPLIDLDLRLGEGTGALLALPLVQSAARAMHDVATFDSAGVTDKH